MSQLHVPRRSRSVLVTGPWVMILVVGCGGSPDAGTAGGRSVWGSGGRGGGSGGGGGGAGGVGFDPDVPPHELERVVIEPSSAALLSLNGSRPTQEFRAYGVYSDGVREELVHPKWSLSSVALGQLDPALGVFTASGLAGGTVGVSVHWAKGDTVPVPVSVRIERTVFEPGLTEDVATSFSTLVDDAASSAALVYPLDHVVMPQNAYPADVQWTGGAVGDVFRVTLQKPSAKLEAYVPSQGGQHGWVVEASAWRALAQTEPYEAAKVRVDRWDAAGGRAIRGNAERTLTFAKAALTGSVYYWDIAAGRIRRIDDGTGQATDFMPSPPPGLGDGICVGCHSVSQSGRYMAGRLGGGENIGAVFDLTTDLTANPAPTVWPISTGARPSLTWWDSSWNRDETRLVAAWRASEAGVRRLKFYDAMRGVEVAVTGSLPPGVQPAWSPDGKWIAYVANSDAWGGALTVGDIGMLEVTGPDAVGGASVVHSGASLASSREGGSADSYPTWTPDSEQVAFAHGQSARSEWTGDVHYQSGVYLMRKDGTQVVRLDAATGGADSVDDFQPHFSPFDQDGYFWMTFLSRRDYGHRSAGAMRQQIWVTAIKKHPAPGEDPSSVPYWLPGQATTSRNISAYWAPRACRQDGQGCTVNSECCGGDCRAGEGGALVCSPPPPEDCRELNETCGSGADCCGGRECRYHVCVDPVPA